MIASERDALTGLANRQGFNRAARTLIDSHPEECFVLAYGDIDRFKVFNDHFGTDAGDRLLADVGKMIATLLPRRAVACRLRADHFVCCMPRDECDPERLLALLDAWFARYPVDFAFFVRLGVYDIDDPSLDVSLMTDRALLALRASKTGPQSSKFVRFDESLRESVIQEQELAGQMSAALKAGQFELYFQPQYCFTAGELVGAEVLARWNHPDKGLISPAEFIPVFERTGLISELDYYIWAEACRCLRTWLDEAGPDGKDRVPRLSVNLSRADIYRPDLRDYLVKIVEQNDVPFDLLHLEITEGFYLEDPEQLVSTVRSLQEAGFTVEMDDFGSGYSSLNALKDVPVDVLKLDLRFLDARNDTRGGVILASVVRMARWLDLPVIAEGVEAESQALFLSSIGCDAMQGFWFSRPVDRVTYEGIMRSAELGTVEPGGAEPRKEVAQLWDAESLVALIFNSYVGPAALAEYDGVQFEVVRANDGFLGLLGLSADAFARTVDEVFGNLSDEDREGFETALSRATDDSCIGECELRVPGRGEEFWVHASMRLLSRSGAVSSVLVLLDETTEKRALRDRLHAAMEGVPGGLNFYQIGKDSSCLLDFNDASAELVGLSREEYLRASEEEPFSFLAEEDQSTVLELVERLRAGERHANATVRARHSDGSLRWFSLSASLMHQSEESLYLVISVLDVTADKERDLQFKAQAELQQRLFESVPCGIVRYLVEGDPQVVSANRAAWTMLGCSSHEEFLAYVADDAFAPFEDADKRMMADVVVQLREGSPPAPFEARLRRFDGGECWIEGVSALAAAPDGRLMVQSAFNDVTEGRIEHHRRELQRFTSVLCSVYDEVFEFDIAHDSYVLCYSAYRPAEDARPVPMHEALARWFAHIPRPEHREEVQAAFDRCRSGAFDEPFSVTYCFEAGGRQLWYETSFLRVSDTSVLCCNNNVTNRMDAEDERLDQRVGDIVNSLPAGIGVYDLDEGGVHPRFVSGAVREMVGVAVDDYDALIEKCASAAKPEEVRSFLAAHEGSPFDFTRDVELERDGRGFTARVQGRAVELANGTLRVYAVIVDVTDEVRAQRERAWQNDRFRILSELTHTISFDYDSHSDTVLLYIDRTGHGMEEQVIPDYLKTLASTRSGVVHPDSIETVRAMFERARAGTRNEIIEYQADYYGTGYQWYRTNLYVAYDETGAWHLIGPIENIQTERELRVRAEHDAITGLSNYASARDLINDALADPHVRVHSVCAAVDLDDFKAINDSYGHLKGDELLQRVGAVLRANCRESDVVGRVGGDEFVLFYKNISLEVAVRKLAMIKRTIALMTLSDEDEGLPRPSISIGATATCETDALYRDVLARADRALYAAKRSGKNRLRLR